MKKWEVIPSKCWRNHEGFEVSMYGAVPFQSETQKAAEGWHIADKGWTVRDNINGTVGCGRKPWNTQSEAQEFCDRWN